MDFELRKLNATDIFPMATILSKIGIDEITGVIDPANLKEIGKIASENTDSEEMATYVAGIGLAGKIAGVIFKNLNKCESDIYSFLSGLSGMKVKEIKELDIDVFLEMIVAVVEKDEFKSFFSVASKFIK